jgi:nitroimidazol reductase NimA-like FMN-containing flavoprotein (pyridoxamine 5'-phosphate oxidase superfamily)
MIGYLGKEESKRLLQKNNFGHIGCNDGFNTYVYPTNYVFDGKHIYCHSLVGSKINVMRGNTRICLQTENITKSSHWTSVMVLGHFEELKEERDRLYAVKLFDKHLLSIKVSETLLAHGITSLKDSTPVFYRISVEEISGRYEGG